MRHAIRKAAFVFGVLALWGVLIVPTVPHLDWLFPPHRRADGLYPADDRKWITGLSTLACLVLANRLAGDLLRALRITEGRWSLFRPGR